MSNLSEEALHNLCYSALSFADNLFQMWLTVTFGAILAIYFSHSNITPFMRRLLIGLYFGASLMLTGRWCVAIFLHFLSYQNQLILQAENKKVFENICASVQFPGTSCPTRICGERHAVRFRSPPCINQHTPKLPLEVSG